MGPEDSWVAKWQRIGMIAYSLFSHKFSDIIKVVIITKIKQSFHHRAMQIEIQIVKTLNRLLGPIRVFTVYQSVGKLWKNTVSIKVPQDIL